MVNIVGKISSMSINGNMLDMARVTTVCGNNYSNTLTLELTPAKIKRNKSDKYNPLNNDWRTNRGKR